MKHKNLKRTLTAAMLTLLAGAAYSQSNSLTAKVPFAFRAAGSDYPAGSYMVAPAQGSSASAGVMQLRNIETGKTVFVPSKMPTKESKQGRPRLIFQCGSEEGCALAALWSGTGSGLEFPTPPLTSSQKERRETIYLDRFKEK